MRKILFASCFALTACLLVGIATMSSARASPLDIACPSAGLGKLAVHIADLAADIDRFATVRDFIERRRCAGVKTFDRHGDVRVSLSTSSLPFSPAARREVAPDRKTSFVLAG